MLLNFDLAWLLSRSVILTLRFFFTFFKAWGSVDSLFSPVSLSDMVVSVAHCDTERRFQRCSRIFPLRRPFSHKSLVSFFRNEGKTKNICCSSDLLMAPSYSFPLGCLLSRPAVNYCRVKVRVRLTCYLSVLHAHQIERRGWILTSSFNDAKNNNNKKKLRPNQTTSQKYILGKSTVPLVGMVGDRW